MLAYRDLKIRIQFKKQEWKVNLKYVTFSRISRNNSDSWNEHEEDTDYTALRKSRNGDIMPPTLPRSCQIISSMLEQPS